MKIAPVEISEKDLEVIGKISKTELGQLVSTQIGFWKWNNLVRMAEKFKRKCKKLGLDMQKVAPKFLVPFLEGASLEDDDDLQEIWASLLASEAEKPGSIAARTLDVLKNMDKKEAFIFQSMFGDIFVSGDDCYIYRYEKKGQNLGNVIVLADCGVLASASHTLNLTIDDDVNNNFPIMTSRDDKKVVFAGIDGAIEKKVQIPIYVLSKAGKELFLALHGDKRIDNLEKIVNDLNKTCDEVEFRIEDFK